MSIINRLQLRLFAAALVFYVLVLTVQVYPFAYYMGAAAFFGLLAIPIRVICAVVAITDSLTGGRILGTLGPRPPLKSRCSGFSGARLSQIGMLLSIAATPIPSTPIPSTPMPTTRF